MGKDKSEKSAKKAAKEQAEPMAVGEVRT